jgi:hypothetical protein
MRMAGAAIASEALAEGDMFPVVVGIGADRGAIMVADRAVLVLAAAIMRADLVVLGLAADLVVLHLVADPVAVHLAADLVAVLGLGVMLDLAAVVADLGAVAVVDPTAVVADRAAAANLANQCC